MITWTIDQTYSEVTITEGTGLLFQWSGSTHHNLIEMSSPQSTSSDCTFVSSDAAALGKVRAYVCAINVCQLTSFIPRRKCTETVF